MAGKVIFVVTFPQVEKQKDENRTRRGLIVSYADETVPTTVSKQNVSFGVFTGDGYLEVFDSQSDPTKAITLRPKARIIMIAQLSLLYFLESTLPGSAPQL
jgi:hypothetical protein